MKKDYFFLEFIKSGPVKLLLILAFIILIGIIITNHHREKVKLKEDVLYVAPGPQK